MAVNSSDLLPPGIAHWPAAAQIAGLILLTFTSEDATTIGGGLLAAVGLLRWNVAFAGCFLGIWIGDAGLYGLARFVGRPVLHWRWFARWFDPGAVKRSEIWFHKKGAVLLFTSRLVPGLRLPTYLAAGFLRLPFLKFLTYTGLACLLWTIGIFAVAWWVGPRILAWLPGFRGGLFALALAILLLLLLWRLTLKALRGNFKNSCLALLGRCRRWEFWPAWLFYPPVASCCLWLALRHRSLTLPTVSNPGIETGGLIGESKSGSLKCLQLTHPQFTAEGYLVEGAGGEARAAALEALRARYDIPYPLILKPDVGQRGSGVRLIASPEAARSYLESCSFPVMCQRYAPGPCEAGIFYYRFPAEARGRILAITEKIFPFLTGDGEHTLSELIWLDARARYQAATFLARFESLQDTVLPKGAVHCLVRAGNHAQGCIFRDGMHLWSEALERRIDEIAQAVPEFYIGRFDIRYADLADLREGRNFLIVELNGAASEVTSIYDARNSLLRAYRVLFHQWRLVFAIGAANRKRGYEPMRLLPLLGKWRQYLADAATHPLAD